MAHNLRKNMNRSTKIICKVFIALALLFALSACGPIYSTNYIYVAPKSWDGRQCANECLQSQTNCHMQCNSQYQSCLNSARLAATPSYLIYVESEQKKGRIPKRTLDDFANYSSCQQTCDCDNTYGQCFTNCGGKIIAQRRCIAFCN